jgi:hypothetical protein
VASPYRSPKAYLRFSCVVQFSAVEQVDWAAPEAGVPTCTKAPIRNDTLGPVLAIASPMLT